MIRHREISARYRDQFQFRAQETRVSALEATGIAIGALIAHEAIELAKKPEIRQFLKDSGKKFAEVIKKRLSSGGDLEEQA